MNPPDTRISRRRPAAITRLAPAVLAVVTVAALNGPAATAYPQSPVHGVAADFDRTGTLQAGGDQARLSGPVNCSEGEQVRLRITINQKATGAVAQATWTHQCTLNALHWHATATVTDSTALKPGCAQAEGLAITRHNGKPVRSLQWLRTITLTTPGNTAPAC
jgi:hypothetical protein